MKKIVCWISLGLTIVFIIFAPRFFERKKEDVIASKTVLVLWHVDTFEGGTGSRQDFLMKSAIAFEKVTPNVYVSVIAHSEESVKRNLESGIVPDLISYGKGVYNVENYAKPLKSHINNVFFNSVKGGNSCYCYPYAYGKYLLFTSEGGKGEGKLISKGKNNLPLFALTLSGEDIGGDVLSPIESYTAFVSGKYKQMVGTQRDVYRLSKRGVAFSCAEVGSFTDLVQYVAVTSKDKEKQNLSESFAKYLISSEVQGRLGEIGLFSTTGERVEYDLEVMNELSNTLPQKVLTPYVDEKTHKELLSNDGNNIFLKKFENYIR